MSVHRVELVSRPGSHLDAILDSVYGQRLYFMSNLRNI